MHTNPIVRTAANSSRINVDRALIPTSLAYRTIPDASLLATLVNDWPKKCDRSLGVAASPRGVVFTPT